MNAIPGFYTIDRAAEILGISQPLIRKYCRSKRLCAHQVGRSWVIKKEDLIAFKKIPRRAGHPKSSHG